MAQSSREIIQTTEELEVGDTVEFTDDTGVEHEGEIVEIQKLIRQDGEGDHRDWLVKSTGDTPDSVLEVWGDREGGPTHVAVSFEDGTRHEVIHIEQTT